MPGQRQSQPSPTFLVYACSGVTCHLYFWQFSFVCLFFTCYCGNTGVERTPNKSQHKKLTVCAVRSIPVLPHWHVKDAGHSAKSAGGRLHLNTRTPLTQRSRSGLIMPLSRHSAGTYPDTSPHATCQGTFGHSRLSSLSHCRPILP